jgi:hypothetical protein
MLVFSVAAPVQFNQPAHFGTNVRTSVVTAILTID